jgi:penicillin-binding protein 1A
MARKGTYTKKVTSVKKAKRGGKRFWRWFKGLSKPKKILLIAGPLLAFLIITPPLTYLYYANDISDQERLMNRNNTGIVMLDKNNETFYSVGKAQHAEMTPLTEISDTTKKALLASEDKDFYKHGGFSFTSILGALYGNLLSGDATAYGGSTLTQQLAKNTLLTDNQTFLRKYQELIVSIAIEQRYSKDQILEMYLNSVYYGENAFGIKEAAKTYFNKNPADLDLAESAMLVGVLPAPSAYSPINGSEELAKERQATVLSRMVKNGVITEAEKQTATTEQLAYAAGAGTVQSEAPHFAQMVLQELYDKYGEEKVTRSGYQVKTTLDLSLQRKLASSISNHIAYIQRNGGSNAGGVAIDPTSGEVRALVGSADWNNPTWGKVNMGTASRQPGSSFKPIYISKALADGVVNPATILADVPTDFGGGFKPQNASRTYSGDITLRNALARSLNIPAVKVMEKLGVNASVEAAKNLGITIDESKNYGLSLALGTAEVPLMEMTNAYAAFANEGQQFNTTIIKQINNKFDDNIYRSQEKSHQAISAQGAFLISSILSDNNARAPIFGSSLTVPGRTAAVKTGTTDDQRDAWTIGYTPELAIGVWVGNNDNEAMRNGGSGMAGPIWINTMKQALTGVANTGFTAPNGIIQKPICYSNGGLSSSSGNGTYDEYFISSALPTVTCSPIKQEEKVEDKPKDETTTNDSTNSTPVTGGGDGSGGTPIIPIPETGGDGSTPVTGGGTVPSTGITVP